MGRRIPRCRKTEWAVIRAMVASKKARKAALRRLTTESFTGKTPRLLFGLMAGEPLPEGDTGRADTYIELVKEREVRRRLTVACEKINASAGENRRWLDRLSGDPAP